MSRIVSWVGSCFHNVAVFWDYENCPIPTKANPADVVGRVVKAARVFGTVKVLKAYTEPAKLSDARGHLTKSAFELHGGSLTCVPHYGKENVIDRKILTDVLLHAWDSWKTSVFGITIVLISGDGDFAEAIRELRQRQCKVVVIAPVNQHHSLSGAASVILDWKAVIDPSPPQSGSWFPWFSHAFEYGQWLEEHVNDDEILPEGVLTDGAKTSHIPTIQNDDFSATSNDEPDLPVANASLLPAAFLPLVQCLLDGIDKGFSASSRSIVGSILAQAEPSPYQLAGCRLFRDYIRRAEELGIVEVGGGDEIPWIRLHPSYRTRYPGITNRAP